MKNKTNHLPLLILLVLFITLACNVTVQTPRIQTGPEVTTKIDEDYPVTDETTRLEINMGAGEINIGEGGKKLVEGEVRTNVALWKPEVIRDDNEVKISQVESKNTITLPSGDLINKWDLKLGTERPIDLKIKAGAYKSTIVVGKIPLKKLSIDDGASQSKVIFDEPNATTMESFKYHTGASQVELVNLANANFKDMNFDSGAGSYTLDFNGELKQDAYVSIKSGLSNVKIIIPSDMNATVELSGGVNNVSPRGTWTIDSNEYRTQSTRGPKLEIDIEMGVGNLELISMDRSSL
ncbi:MAG: hypothetical protein GYA15_15800 [Leptolinea sp.]|jgi:hypothetical protein|nr:hypothetical protein [Leptolinea sp.]